jgi:hypothetical protein
MRIWWHRWNRQSFCFDHVVIVVFLPVSFIACVLINEVFIALETKFLWWKENKDDQYNLPGCVFKRFFINLRSICRDPLLLFSLCYIFYRFLHTYAQSIGLQDVHSLSVKCRRFDTFKLLLPFNGPIKLFCSCPFDQSDATSLLILFFSIGKCACPLLAICSSGCAYEQSTNISYLIVFSFYRNVLRVKDKKNNFFHLENDSKITMIMI